MPSSAEYVPGGQSGHVAAPYSLCAVDFLHGGQWEAASPDDVPGEQGMHDALVIPPG